MAGPGTGGRLDPAAESVGEFGCDIAEDAGIELGRTGAIRVTERLETNLSGVFAAGDCAEATHLLTGRPVWLPLGTTANKMGRIAGANAAGRPDQHHRGPRDHR